MTVVVKRIERDGTFGTSRPFPSRLESVMEVAYGGGVGVNREPVLRPGTLFTTELVVLGPVWWTMNTVRHSHCETLRSRPLLLD